MAAFVENSLILVKHDLHTAFDSWNFLNAFLYIRFRLDILKGPLPHQEGAKKEL